MFRKRSDVEVIQGLGGKPIAGQYKLDDTEPALFELKDPITVDKIKVTKRGSTIVVEVGDDNGSYLAVKVN